MKDVARAAGVSAMAVSLALRRDPSIPESTRARILAVASDLGYRPNPLVSVLMARLRHRKSRGREAQVIAYVESFPATAPRQQRESLRRYRNGAAESARGHGYHLELFRLGGEGLTEPRLAQVMLARGIRGAVLAPFPQTGSILRLPWENCALATIGFSLAQPRLHRAVNHQIHSIRLALAELARCGHRRIGVVLSRHEDARVESNWISSVLLAQYEHAGTPRAFPLLHEDKIVRARLRAWLERERPEVVVSTDDIRPLLRGARRDAGQKVGFAHLHLTAALPGCSGIDQNNERVGAAAVDLVVEQLQANQFGVPANPKTVLIEGRWEPGTR